MAWWPAILVAVSMWTLWGQSGYIHPDEFFQSIEVVAGDALNISVFRSWEFDVDNPVRSIVLPQIVCGLPVLALKCLSCLTDLDLVGGYTLLLVPRLAMLGLSLLNATLVYKLTKLMQVDTTSTMWCYATSYLSAVFFTRTLSNTLEAFFFTSLIYLVYKSRKERKKFDVMSYLRSLGNGDGDQQNPKVWYEDEEADKPELVTATALVLTCGMFNRPTFVLYAVVPCLMWLFEHWSENWRTSIYQLFSRGMTLSMFVLLFSFLFVLWDTYYYRPVDVYTFLSPMPHVAETGAILTFGQLEYFKKLAFTPLNFVLYNLNSDNLSEHGLHPRITHILVNAPMLFHILAVFVYFHIASHLLKRLANRPTNLTPNKRYLLLMYTVPLVMLSVFPHQEPRFLIPLLTPVVLLYGETVFCQNTSMLWKTLWIVSNLICATFFGTFHQAGVVPSLQYLQKLQPCNRHIIFYHTYMPPRHLLNIPKSAKPGDSICDGLTHVHDLKGATSAELHVKLQDTLLEARQGHGNYDILLLAPSLLDEELCKDRFNDTFLVTTEEQFFPHFSSEDPPNFSHVSACGKSEIKQLWPRIKNALSLNLYRILPK